MVKKLLINVAKVFFFAFSFIAYWYSLDEKYYRYREDKKRVGEENKSGAVLG